MKQNTITLPIKEILGTGEGIECKEGGDAKESPPKGGDKWEWQTINVIGQIMLHKLSNAERHCQKGAPHKVEQRDGREGANTGRCKQL